MEEKKGEREMENGIYTFDELLNLFNFFINLLSFFLIFFIYEINCVGGRSIGFFG